MNDDPSYTVNLLLVAAAAVALFVLAWRGSLRRDALLAGPPRELGLRWFDLPLGLLIMLIGTGVVAGFADQALARLGLEGIRGLAVVLLVTQVLGQGLVLLYVLARTVHMPDAVRRFGLVPRSLGVEGRDAGLGLLALPLVLGTLSLMTLIGEWIGQPAPTVGHEYLQALMSADDPLGWVLMTVAVVAVGPFLEEVIFRGLVQTSLLNVIGREHRWLIIIVAGVGFAMIHAGPGTFAATDGSAEETVAGVPWHALPGLAVLGIALGYLYERTGSLWPVVLVHGAFNALNVAMVMLEA